MLAQMALATQCLISSVTVEIYILKCAVFKTVNNLYFSCCLDDFWEFPLLISVAELKVGEHC